MNFCWDRISIVCFRIRLSRRNRISHFGCQIFILINSIGKSINSIWKFEFSFLDLWIFFLPNKIGMECRTPPSYLPLKPLPGLILRSNNFRVSSMRNFCELIEIFENFWIFFSASKERTTRHLFEVSPNFLCELLRIVIFKVWESPARSISWTF